jgi:preprotein translocase subunit SecE
MADEKKTVKETQETGKTNKFVAFFKNLPQNIATPFKNMWHELKKVTWPTKPDLIKYVGIVVVFMVFMGVVIGLLDMGSSRLVAAISSLKGTEEQIILTEDTAATVDEAATEAAETAQEAAEQATEAAEQAAEEVTEQATEAAQQAAETVQEAVENETQQATEGTTEEAPANN